MAYNNLTIGSAGKEVEQLQKELIARGYDLGKTGADSIYGQKTAEAVRKYQQDNGLQTDGIAGNETLSHLYGSQSETPEQSTVLTPQKPQYTDPYAQQLQALYDKVVKLPEFSYNINEDALFAQYRDSYTRLGQLAMEDAMGRSAAYTGGYGSSYSQAVGQQAYQEQLQELHGVVPQLEQRAYDRYRQEQEALLEQYSLTWQKAQEDYDRYRDALSDYEKQSAQAYERLQQLITQTGYTPTAQELADAGMTQAQAQAYRSAYTAKNTSKNTSKYTGGSSQAADNSETQAEKPYVDLDALKVGGYVQLQEYLQEMRKKSGSDAVRTQLAHWLEMGYINETARELMLQWLSVPAEEVTWKDILIMFAQSGLEYMEEQMQANS